MPDAINHEPSASELELAAILDRYRQEFQRGDDPDPEACLGAHPELAGTLADCLHGLAAMEELRNALSAVPSPTPFAQRSLGDFQLVREIGRGGMGVVYEAIDARLHRTVALKRIKAGILADGQEFDMFRKEARAAAALQHPNIVQLYEVGEHEGQPYLVLEYVDGGGLDAKLAGTPIDPYEAAQLLATLAQAMHYAHEHGIVHRDLKPANVLLTSDGIPKITDFGLAKHLHADLGHTQTGTIKGTASYMASEQANGGTITEVTDVYALGAILYETLTGRPPFRGATPLDTLTQVTTLEPVPPSRLQPNVPRDLETICLKCLQKEPQKRYDSAQGLADDLGRFLRHEPIHARPVGVGGRVWRWCRRNPVVAALLSVTAALTVLIMLLIVLRFADQSGRNEKILSDNVLIANHTANTILVDFWRLAEHVERVANDPKIRAKLKADRENLIPVAADGGVEEPRVLFFLEEKKRQLQHYFKEIYEKGPKGRDGNSAFHTWHIVDKEGILLADFPPAKKRVFGVCFKGRDYFIGAKRHLGTVGRARVHVSRAYRSANDDKYKITLSAIVYAQPDKHDEILGVVCATLPTDATLGDLDLKNSERTTVLVGQRDAAPFQEDPAREAPPAEYGILVHPAYTESGRDAVLVRPEMLPMLPERRRAEVDDEFVPTRDVVEPSRSRNSAYEDPLGKSNANYEGRWLAGFAQVGNMEMVVIVQQRPEELWPIWYWPLLAGVTLLAAGIVAGAFWRRRRARPLAAPPTPAIESAATVSYLQPQR